MSLNGNAANGSVNRVCPSWVGKLLLVAVGVVAGTVFRPMYQVTYRFYVLSWISCLNRSSRKASRVN